MGFGHLRHVPTPRHQLTKHSAVRAALILMLLRDGVGLIITIDRAWTPVELESADCAGLGVADLAEGNAIVDAGGLLERRASSLAAVDRILGCCFQTQRDVLVDKRRWHMLADLVDTDRHEEGATEDCMSAGFSDSRFESVD